MVYQSDAFSQKSRVGEGESEGRRQLYKINHYSWRTVEWSSI